MERGKTVLIQIPSEMSPACREVKQLCSLLNEQDTLIEPLIVVEGNEGFINPADLSAVVIGGTPTLIKAPRSGEGAIVMSEFVEAITGSVEFARNVRIVPCEARADKPVPQLAPVLA